MKIYIWLLLLLAIISFWAIGQSLSFALNGDDWLALWRYIKDFTSFQSLFDIRNYSNEYSNYTFANLLMGLIYKLFSYNPFPYYLISLFLRILAALSFYPAIYSATKNKMAGYLSAILFSTMFAGIETTNWVFNMNTYLAIALLNIFLYLYFRIDHKSLSKSSMLVALILAGSFFVAPTRMHGLLLVIPLLCLFKIKNSKKGYFEFMIRLLTLYLPILIGRYITRATNDKGYFETFIHVSENKFEFLFNLFLSLAHSLIPDKILNNIFHSDSRQFIFVVIFYALLAIFFFKNKVKSPHLANFGLFSQAFAVCFMLIPHLISPTINLPTEHRYQIIPGSFMLVGIAIACSILWQKRNSFLKSFIVILLILLTGMNFLTLRNYFSILAREGRLQDEVKSKFSYILSQIEKPKNNAPLVLLFIPDNAFYLYNTISFGFPYHIILIDSRFSLDIQKAPFVVDNITSLIDVLSSKDSSELKRYGYKPIEIPLENIYAFSLQNKDLTNITSDARIYLKERLPGLNQIK